VAVIEARTGRDFGTYRQLLERERNKEKIKLRGLEMCFNGNFPASCLERISTGGHTRSTSTLYN